MSEIPQRLLHESLLASARRCPDGIALVAEDRRYSYGELSDAAHRTAAALLDRGLERGDRVAIYMDNTWACAASIFGVLLAGGVFLVVNPQTKPDKLAYVLDDSEASFLLSDAHLARFFVPLLPDRPALRGVLSSGSLPGSLPAGAPPVESLDAVMATGEPGGLPERCIPLDLAALVYTSGSTGHPKGVMLTHQSMVFTATSLIEYLRISAADRILNVLPLAFDYGLYQLLMSVRLGATLVLERSFAYPARALQRMADEGVTVFPGVPTLFALLRQMHGRERLAFPGVRCVTNTAAALPADFVPELREIFPNAQIYKMYGLTECKRATYLEPELLDRKPGSVGRAIPGTEVFLLSPEGERVATGEPGILHIRGPHVMLGYWKQPERSAEMLREGPLPGERVLCTHDWFRMDEEGLLYFLGRSDDIIKSRGEKVSPVEVENALLGIPGIREAAVIGVPDGVLGEAIHAYVALEEGASLDAKQIGRICHARLESYMVPQEFVFLAELPKTTTGKIRKKGLEELRAA